MSKINSLSLLVGSLTKAEKRYFKMYTTLQEGEKDYLLLFNLLEKGNEWEVVKEVFKQKNQSFF